MHAPPQKKPTPPARAKQAVTRPVRAPLPATNRTGLPIPLKMAVERRSGLAMDDVQVHYNSSRPAQLQALAYTQGTEIHVGPGQERHLAHEAWHVVQQKQGRVRPTLQMKGANLNDDEGLEREADAMASAVQSGAPANGAPDLEPVHRPLAPAVSPEAMPVQRVVIVATLPDVEVEKSKEPDFLTGTGLPKDMGVVNRATALAKSHGTKPVPIEKADFSTLGNDMLYIYGHGTNQGKGEMTMSASALAATLKKQGLKANSKITLMGCGSGKGYATDVEKALKDAGIACSEITAGLDVTTTDSRGQNYVLTSKAQSDIMTAILQVKPPTDLDIFDPLKLEKYEEDKKKAVNSVTLKNMTMSSQQGVPQSLAPDIWAPLVSNAKVIKQGDPKVKEQPDFLS